MTVSQDERRYQALDRILREIEKSQATSRPSALRVGDEIGAQKVAQDAEFRAMFGLSELDEPEPGEFFFAPDSPRVRSIADRINAAITTATQPTETGAQGATKQLGFLLSPVPPQAEGQAGQFGKHLLESGATATAGVMRPLRGAVLGAPFGPGGMVAGALGELALPAALPSMFGIQGLDQKTLTPQDVQDMLDFGIITPEDLKKAQEAGEGVSPALVDIGTSLGMMAGGAVLGYGGMKLADALKLPIGIAATRGQQMGRFALTGGGLGLGGGAGGNAAYAALTGRPVLESAAIGGAFGAGTMLIPGVGIPLAKAGLVRVMGNALVRSRLKGPLGQQYAVLEREMANLKATPGAMEIPAGHEFLSLTEKQIAQARRSALRLGLPVDQYALLLDEVALETASWPRLFDEVLNEAVWRTSRRMGMKPAIPDWAAELPEPLRAVEAFEAGKTPTALGKWVRKVGDKMGFAPAEAHRLSRTLLQEYHGGKTYSAEIARHRMAANWEKMTPEERERAGTLLHGNIEPAEPFGREAVARGVRFTMPARGPRVRETDPDLLNEIAARKAGMDPEAGRAFELRRLGQGVAEEGRLTLAEEKAAIEGDPLLSSHGKDTTFLIRYLVNAMEDEIAESGMGHVYGKGLYFNRAWIAKETLDALESGNDAAFKAALMDPTAIAIRGAARLERDFPILEVDQRLGGAWWVRDLKTGKPVKGVRFTDPNAAGRYVGAQNEAGKNYRVISPITWEEAAKGTTEMGKLVIDDILPAAVRYVELGNDLAANRLLRDIASNPLLTKVDPNPRIEAPRGWMRIGSDEGSKQTFGDLAGKLVRTNIAEHITDITKTQRGLWHGLMRGWVWSRLAQNPSTHFRNMYWDAISLDHPSIGLPPYRSLPYLAEAAQIYSERDPLFNFFVRSGMVGGEFGESVKKMWNEHLMALSKSGEESGWSLWDKLKSDLSFSSKVYGAEDQIFAIAGALKLMREDGLGPMAAVSRVKEAFSDFRLMRKNWPGTGIKMGEGPLQNPFVRFDVEQLRVFSNAVRRGPEGLLWFAKWYGMYPAMMTAASLAASGLTWDEFVKIQRQKPKWRTGDLYGVLLPFPGRNEKGGKEYFTVDISSWLPFMDIGSRADVRLDQMFEEEDLGWPGKIGWGTASRLFTNPVTTALVAGASGLNMFTGRSLREAGEGESWARLREIYRGITPLPGTMPGFYWEGRFRKAVEGQKEGRPPRPIRLSNVLPRFAGIKFQTIDPDLDEKTFKAQFGPEYEKAQEERAKLRYEFKKLGKYTREEYNAHDRAILARMAAIKRRKREPEPSTIETLLQPFLSPGKEK